MGSSNNPFNFGHHSLLKKLLSYPLYALLPLLLIHFYFNPFSFSPPSDNFLSSNHIIISSPSLPPPSQGVPRQNSIHETPCDYTIGEWVPNKLEPLYTSCDTIKHGQNCMVNGRPDRDYLHWKWKPKQCKLPRFDPKTFLKLLKNQHIAFVGDSLARNQLESLLCMLATVAKPYLYYTDGEENKFRKWHFSADNVNISVYWSPFLVKGVEKTVEKNFNTLFLESVNERWADDLTNIDMLVLSAGHWYLHPAVYHYGNKILGCHFSENCTEVGFYGVFGKALRTTFEAIIGRKGPTGKGINVFLTTFSPAHFEGEWDKLGACPKTKPYKESEQILEGMNEDMWRIGVEEVKKAKFKAEEFGDSVKVVALDVSKLALMRPDGHPGPYMNPFPFANGVSEHVQNDCVHWCLPGPIDAWNEILLDVLKRWRGENR